MQVDPKRNLFRGILNLASGEIPARVCGIATVLVLARKSGVVMVGLYALAQSMVQYTYPFIDFGLRHVGARLIANYPNSGREILRRVQARRLSMALGILPLLLLYTLVTRVSLEGKIFLFLFSAISCLYALSLEWAAWGKEHLRLVGAAKAIVPGSVLVFLLIGLQSGHFLWWMLAGATLGYLTQGTVFWEWWRKHRPAEEQGLAAEVVRESLAWKRTSIMGLAWFCNLAFNTIDMLMLGAMSTPHQVGLYSAAYRIMNQVLFTYYLLIQVLYPRLARQDAQERPNALRPGILVPIVATGMLIALALDLSGKAVLSVVFGKQFVPGLMLLLILAWAIPLDFLTSYMSNAYIAWALEKKVLLCTATAAAVNVILNFIWIPSHGAVAAAVNTLVSYAVFLAGLAFVGRQVKQLSRVAQRHQAVAPMGYGGEVAAGRVAAES